MLTDLDRSVAAFLARLLPAGTAIRFCAPAPSWADAPPESPLIDAFLYDIRETQPPAADGALTRDADGHATGWQPPVRRYRVSYLLTAWTEPDPPGTSEHELLGAVLVGCAAVHAIPDDCLHGSLAEAAESLPFACAGQERARDPALIWPALSVPARTALDLMVIAPIVPPLTTELAPSVRGVTVGAHRTPNGAGAAGTRIPGARAARPEHRITETS
jgi:hypothetical protein